MVDAFKEGKFELFALTETKMKRNGEISWCEVGGISVEVQKNEDEEPWGSVGVLLNV